MLIICQTSNRELITWVPATWPQRGCGTLGGPADTLSWKGWLGDSLARGELGTGGLKGVGTAVV